MLVLVTGATGFVGGYLVRQLLSQGHQVRCLVRSTSTPGHLKGLPVELAPGDITQAGSLSDACAGAGGIIHLAAIIREKGRATFRRVNTEGTQHLVAAAQRAGVGRFIYMSNLGVRGPEPAYPFLHSKWLGEEAVREGGLAYTIFRPSVMFGLEDRFINVLADLIRRAPVVPVIGPGRTRFQLISVAEVARCLAAALEDSRFTGQTVEIGGPEHLGYEEIIDLIIRTLGKRRLKVHIPVPLMRPVVWLMERLLPQPPLTSQQLSMLGRDNITELDAVERWFGFRPTPLGQEIGYIRQSRRTG
ncbi:MAG: complex I NDUFA9 subunit family protein [Dehalococcoidia bacterium]